MREPELEQVDAVVDQHAARTRGTVLRNCVGLLRRAEPHHRLDAGAVVPGAVEQHLLARRRQPVDIALEIPLRPLAVAGLGQRHRQVEARVEVLRGRRDRAALAGRVAALEQR